MTERFRCNKKSGFALIEAVVGLALASIIIGAFIDLALRAGTLARVNMSEIKAGMYLREGIEITKDLELSNWNGLDANCTYLNPCHPTTAGSSWVLTSCGGDLATCPLEEGSYKRGIDISVVCRDGSETIVECSAGGTQDDDTKKARVRVEWNNGMAQRLITMESYLIKSP